VRSARHNVFVMADEAHRLMNSYWLADLGL
jgi:hypothetical protein